jgi:hypothetical protein
LENGINNKKQKKYKGRQQEQENAQVISKSTGRTCHSLQLKNIRNGGKWLHGKLLLGKAVKYAGIEGKHNPRIHILS